MMCCITDRLPEPSERYVSTLMPKLTVIRSEYEAGLRTSWLKPHALERVKIDGYRRLFTSSCRPDEVKSLNRGAVETSPN
jgi:hypothetical protein